MASELLTQVKHTFMKAVVPIFEGIRYVPLCDVDRFEGGKHAYPDQDAVWLFPEDKVEKEGKRHVTLVQPNGKGEVRREFREYVPSEYVTDEVTLFLR